MTGELFADGIYEELVTSEVELGLLALLNRQVVRSALSAAEGA